LFSYKIWTENVTLQLRGVYSVIIIFGMFMRLTLRLVQTSRPPAKLCTAVYCPECRTSFAVTSYSLDSVSELRRRVRQAASLLLWTVQQSPHIAIV